VITPRQTRLHRVADLRNLQLALASLIDHDDPWLARSCAVLVPSRAAAGQLRHTLETLILGKDGPGAADTALVLPDLATRSDWYGRLYERLRNAPPLVDQFEREVIMGEAARAAAGSGAPPPFRLRPGLIAEIVRFLDELHRLQRTVSRFEEQTVDDLSADADSDRGAGRLLEQTRFLVSTFQKYQARLAALECLDEQGLRGWLLEHPLHLPYTHVIVAVADRTAEREGLWPADFDLLTRLPRLERIDVVATESVLASGFHERLHQMLPGIEEEKLGSASSPPTLLAPADGDQWHVRRRDREDELSHIARGLKQDHGGERSLSRTAVVFKRPLPYVYLAREVFDSAGIPYQAVDALPLAAEPYAAAVDLVFDAASSNFSRAALVALLRSPHFTFKADGRPPGRRAVSALDRRLAAAGYLGGAESLAELVGGWAAAEGPSAPSASVQEVAGQAVALAGELAPLRETVPASEHLTCLLRFLRQHDRLPAVDDALRERHLRARAAIQSACERLSDAYQRIDDRSVDLADVVATVRRWIEAQTFSPRTGSDGIQLVDAPAARFGLFDDVHLVGLVETEWPDRAPRNIFYPPFLLKQLGWPAESDRLLAARAAFRDLTGLARQHVSVSTFSLEDDAIVGPSAFLEDLEGACSSVARTTPTAPSRVFAYEAVSLDPVTAAPLSAEAATWLALRRARRPPSSPEFRGEAGIYERPVHAVSALETYLECPFKYFARHVLRLEEERDEDESRRPREQGIFLHRVFQAFFAEWGRQGHAAVTLENVDRARELFGRVVEPLLADLPEAEAALHRTRLFGSAAAEGLAEIVFRVEAELGADVVERLLEHPIEGEFEMQGPDGPRRVALRGVADRIDLLADGTLRVIDYKSGRAPNQKRMLQLPIYGVCASQQLEGRHGRSWTAGDGGYIAFRGPRRFVSLSDRRGLEAVVLDAQARLLAAVDNIRAGHFPPSPIEPFRCNFCSYAGVCRKDYVGDE